MPSDSPLVSSSTSSGELGSCAGASLRASFLACLSSLRSRSRLSRVSFAIVVFFLPLEAMSVRPFLWSSEHLARKALCQLDVPGLGPLVASLGVVGDLRAFGE